MKRTTKRRIRKALKLTRNLALATCGVCLLLTICSATMWTLGFAIKCTVCGVVCFGLVCALNYVLFGTIYGEEIQ